MMWGAGSARAKLLFGRRYLLIVMAGLDPAIHAFAAPGKGDVDARVKPAHDE
jgi:hypothetical protein